MSKTSIKSMFLDGVLTQNPVFVQLLGMCPTLATTTSVVNGIGMGISAAAVLTGSNVVISLLRKFIPQKIRIASYIVIIAGFVTLIDMLLKAYFPSISNALGIFIPLIVVNCIILARAESFASKNNVGLSALDGIFTGLGFTAALIVISAIREVLGNGSFLGMPLFGESFQPALIFIMPAGSFIVLGLLMGLVNVLKKGGK